MGLFSRKKKIPPEERKPLELPEISEEDLTIQKVAELIKSGTSIWLRNNLGFIVYVLDPQDNHIKKYLFDNYEDGKIYLLLNEIMENKYSRIIDIYNRDITDSYHVYYDNEGMVVSDDIPQKKKYLYIHYNLLPENYTDRYTISMYVGTDTVAEIQIRVIKELCACRIEKFWVDQAYRAHGIGRKLFAAAEEEAATRGAKRILVYPKSERRPNDEKVFSSDELFEIYRHLGFEDCEEGILKSSQMTKNQWLEKKVLRGEHDALRETKGDSAQNENSRNKKT